MEVAEYKSLLEQPKFINQQVARGRLKQFYRAQFSNRTEGFSFFGRLFRFWFGWFQDSRIVELQKYLSRLAAKDLVDKAEIQEILDSSNVQYQDNPATDFLTQIIADQERVERFEALSYDPRNILSKDPSADLNNYPSEQINQQTNAHSEITIGDLHGNAMKLIYFLVREGILTGLNADDYQELTKIYQTRIEKLSAEGLTKFNTLIAKTKLNPKDVALNPKGVAKIRLIGDVLADRGECDYYTLMILAHLKKLGASVEILISNHDAEFLNAYVMQPFHFKPTALREGQARSMDNLKQLLWIFNDRIDEVKAAIREAYKPALKLLSYSLSADGKHITIYTHAPVGIETIFDLAEYFDVSLKMNTAQELAATIDAINAAANNHFGGITRLVKASLGENFNPNRPLDDPIYRLMWARHDEANLFGLARPAKIIPKQNDAQGYTLAFVHGHDQPFFGLEQQAHIHCLDSDFGKFDDETLAEHQQKGTKLDLSYVVHRIDSCAAPTVSTSISPSDSSASTVHSSSPTEIPSPINLADDQAGSPRQATSEAGEDEDDEGTPFIP